jgi:hypothetical protein
MPETLPALSLVAVPGRRHVTLDVAREAERRGFAGLYVPSMFGNMAQCTALALATGRAVFGTAIAPIYSRTVEDFAQSAAFVHETSGGRFRFGIGVAHAPSHRRMGVVPGRPLADIRDFVARFRAYDGFGALPPIILAALRKRMVALAGEIADGLILRRLTALAASISSAMQVGIMLDPEPDERPLARGCDAVRPGRAGARGCRGVARRRRHDADPCAALRLWKPAQGGRGNLRRLCMMRGERHGHRSRPL